jgi:predicted DCC family thiol-disulfide oxidoreductase YuxK
VAFKIFYDGQCPLCEIEIEHLKKRNTENRLAFVDITAADFADSYPHLDYQALDARIHGQHEDGRMVVGFDVMHEAWSRIGVRWLYGITRLPILRSVFDKIYLLFAKRRHKISYLLTRKERCESHCESKLK